MNRCWKEQLDEAWQYLNPCSPPFLKMEWVSKEEAIQRLGLPEKARACIQCGIVEENCKNDSFEFVRTGANQNIDPEYVRMVAGVSEDLLGKADD